MDEQLELFWRMVYGPQWFLPRPSWFNLETSTAPIVFVINALIAMGED